MKSPWLWYGSAGKFATGYLILLGVAIAGQSLTHVYRSDLNWADEGSHYVSGLMVHDYVADKLPGSPIAYATRYYIHYPKVGIGHWPPLYYLVEAAGFFFDGPEHPHRAVSRSRLCRGGGGDGRLGRLSDRRPDRRLDPGRGGKPGDPGGAQGLPRHARRHARCPDRPYDAAGDARLGAISVRRGLAVVRRLRPNGIGGNNDKGQRRRPRSAASVFDSSIEPVPIAAQLAVLAARADHRSADRALVFADLQNYG